MGGWIVGFAATGKNHCTYIDAEILCSIVIVDGTCGTYCFALFTFPLGEKKALAVIDCIFQRYSLGVIDINSFAFGEPAIEFVDYFFGTLCSTRTTGDTLVHIHVAWVLGQRDSKISMVTCYIRDL